MRSAHRSSIVLASAMIVAGLAGCGTDTPTTPEAAESAALEHGLRILLSPRSTSRGHSMHSAHSMNPVLTRLTASC